MPIDAEGTSEIARRWSTTYGSRTWRLLERLGHPEKRLPPVVHVAGTKGKGSTVAMIATMLDAAGYRVGCSLSPHVHRIEERIGIGGKPIGPAALTAAFTLGSAFAGAVARAATQE